MNAAIILLLGFGLFLSAFFSGNETGFYRVTRLRLLLDGLGGDRISRQLLRLTNHPALFVATTLVGNNVANYLLSLGVVLAAERLFHHAHLAELLAPLAFSPLVFIYGELLPKQLFLYAPNRLLRRSGPLLLLFTALLAPIAAVLWTLGRLLESLIGQTPLRVRFSLARQELQQAMLEGLAAGILHPIQRDLATRIFANAPRSVAHFCTPMTRVRSIPMGTTVSTALQLARRNRSATLPVSRAEKSELIGYVRVIDLLLANQETVQQVRSMTRISVADSHIHALMQMQRDKTDVAILEDADGISVGLIFADQLTAPLFQDA